MVKQSFTRVPIQVKGAIFDLDGTLLDSMGVWDTVGDRFLIQRGIAPPPQLRRTLKPMRLTEAIAYLKERYQLKEPISQLMQEATALIEPDYRHNILLKPTALPFLETLAAYKIPLCIATATDRPLAEAAIRRLKIDHYFSDLITCTEVGIGKDRPDIYFHALSLLGTAQDETIVFEDARHAVETAAAAGFHVAAVYDPSAKTDAAAIQKAADWYLPTYDAFWTYFDRTAFPFCSPCVQTAAGQTV